MDVKFQRGKEKTSFYKILSSLLLCFVVAIFASTILFISRYEYHPVVENSMVPTINDGDELNGVYIDREATPTYGDIVVLKVENKSVIKRAMAFEGDGIGFYYEQGYFSLLRLRDGEVEYLEEGYILSKAGNRTTHALFMENIASGAIVMDTTVASFEGQEVTFYLVGEDEIFVLGDNRAGSRDSSTYGPQSIDSVVGVAMFLTPRVENEFLNGFVQFFYIMKKIIFFEGRNI